MAENTNRDQVLQDIAQRVEAAMSDKMVSQDDVRRLITEEFESFVSGEEGKGRKFRFGNGQDSEPSALFGSKFSRYKLDLHDIEFLYDLQMSLRQANPTQYKGPSEELQAAFKSISNAYYMSDDEIADQDQRAVHDYFKHEVKENDYHGNDRKLAARGAFEETEAYQRAIRNVRDMGTGQSGTGQELVGVGYVGDLWDQGMTESRISGMIRSYEMKAATDYLPVAGAIPEMYYVSEKVGAASDYGLVDTGSNRVQVDAKKFIIHQLWPTEMEEDSIVPFVPLLREMAQFSIGYYSDSAILNGDTTNAATGNINLDDADPADTKHYLAFDGLRHVGIVDNTSMQADAAAGAISLALLMKPRERMVDTTYHNDWGNPSRQEDFIQVADPTTAARIAQLDQVINWKIQQGRSFDPGQVAEILGGPVFGHVAMSKTEADGKVSTTGGNNTLGQVLSFNRNAYVIGWLRRVRTAVESVVSTDQMRITYTLRKGFGRYTPTGAASGIKSADVIYNISLA